MVDLIKVLPGMSTMLRDFLVAFFLDNLMKAIDVVPKLLFA